jgi:gliding motility-associated lipoprotein GldH
MEKSVHRQVCFLFIVLIMFACDQETIFDHVVNLPIEGWNYKDKINFLYTVSDTVMAYDIRIQ